MFLYYIKKMAFYNSGVKSNVYDPVLTLENNRVEWQLPRGALFLSSLRLHNLGATIGTADTQWNKKGGILSYIKNITLYDGSVVLDQLREVAPYMAFKNYNKANRNNVGLEILKVGHQIGYLQNSTHGGQIVEAYQAPEVKQTTGTTSRFAVDLRRVLPFLRNSQFLPSMIYKNLRLVVEFNVDALSTLHDASHIGDLTTLQDSLLVVDELVNESVVAQAMKQYKGVSFSAIEHDAFQLPADAQITGEDQSSERTTSTILHGFQGKFCNRLLMFASPVSTLACANADNTLISAGKLRAVANLNENIQIRLNGANMFGGQGINQTSEKLAMLHDTWGMCDHAPGSELIGVFSNDSANPVGLASAEYTHDITNSNSYFGCFIRDRVESLQVDYTATQFIPAGAGFPQVIGNGVQQAQDLVLGGQAQQVNVYAEVRKSVLVNGDNYSVIYN